MKGLSANKRLGQHFLFDRNLLDHIARLAGPLEDCAVLEVGPGPGGLTSALLTTGALVAAVEKDRRFLPGLEDLAARHPGRLFPVLADALKIDERALLTGLGLPGPQAIIANLPYNLASPLLAKWLTGPLRPASMTLMFQKEVAERIVALPGSADYGRLSVLAQALTAPRIVLRIGARAFTPPPKIDSALVRFESLADRPDDAGLAALQAVARAAFGQRRKMLRSSLRALGGEALCRAAGLDPTLRAENVSVDRYLALAAIFSSPGLRPGAPEGVDGAGGASVVERTRD
ncbi:MAG: 16S rRNA (adenine(1518)-N(6)/adenine(1519)-N(6))-dimethyltransferase RsmA [Caulobacteraceae bacterium]